MTTKETNKHLWEIRPPFPPILKPPGIANRDREWPWTTETIIGGQSSVQRTGRLAVNQLAAMFRESSSLLLGVVTLESKRKCLSVNKGTREAQSCRVVAQSLWLTPRQIPLMKRLGGGVSVVVRGRESRPHGKGRQNDLFWTTNTFVIERVFDECR